MAIGLGRRGCSVALVLGLAALLPATAQAQKVASNFDELHGRVLLGETVKVTDATGRATRGKLLKLTDTDLTVRIGEREQTVPGSDIVEVKARRMGPLWNGAVIGAAVPLTIFGVVWAKYGGGECYDCATGLAIWTGIGAGLGVGIDALVKGDITVMKKGAPAKRSIAVAPVVSRDRRGVLCAIRF
ncbi:MAG: hypothetical protein A3H96_03560 [Acidobacteria bacterium RIFCSPLOWO2_02_FULL_67_36]|nr:MAG: hypothetical protein A3H96_03560 [Acidobacteria bacterium RIFCSPLOWO2_02_FULL_67_36]OFW22789.1 MAG: hypothetical protein A3G21_26245 [Acidobacteria bacterium RIFCSPLOWO2_12_FULL_66_21]